MMRTALRTAISIIYLALSVGTTVATHFCGDEPVSARLLKGAQEDAPCCCGDEDSSQGCCTTGTTTIRGEDAHEASDFGSSPLAISAPVLMPRELLVPRIPFVFPPTLWHQTRTDVPTHLLDCSFLI